ncbi:prepilin peptidase [Listeria kieliensis]
MFFINTFIFSAIFASFIQVAATHLPLKQSFMFRFSKCDFCQRRLTFFEMIPLLSFLALCGKTWCCNQKLSRSYFAIELIFPILFTLLVYFEKNASNLLLLLICLTFLFFFSLTDLTYLYIPDAILAIFLGIILLVRLREDIPFTSILWQFLCSLLFYGLIYYIFRKGFGMGDAKLLIVLGTALGFETSYWIFFLALASANLILGFAFLCKKISRKQKVPFVPFLFTGFLIQLIL